MKIKNVLFDLDGTITDSKPGITRAAAYALRHVGITEEPENLSKIVGPPLLDAFREIYNLPDEKALYCLSEFRSYFSEIGIYENAVYDGVEDMLNRLKNAGFTLMIATAKPEVFAVRVLENFKLTPYFDYVVGSKLDGSRAEKVQVIQYIFDTKGISAENAVMIGDRKYDVLGARAVGLRSIGVLWGYGSREELEAAGANCFAEKPEDVYNKILQLG